MEWIVGLMVVVMGVVLIALYAMKQRTLREQAHALARKKQASKEKRSASAKAAAQRKKLQVLPTTERADVNRQYVAPNPGETALAHDSGIQQDRNAGNREQLQRDREFGQPHHGHASYVSGQES